MLSRTPTASTMSDVVLDANVLGVMTMPLARRADGSFARLLGRSHVLATTLAPAHPTRAGAGAVSFRAARLWHFYSSLTTKRIFVPKVFTGGPAQGTFELHAQVLMQRRSP